MAALRRCLVTGATGFLGREAGSCLSAEFEVLGLSRRHAGRGLVQADIRDAAAFQLVLRKFRPDIVVHCAAYRDPDFCEENPGEAWRLNVEPVRVLRESLSPDAWLVFVSSDYVFDGESPPYAEDSPRRPVSAYGRSKREAEDLVMGRPRTLVVRSPLLIGAGPSLDSSGFIGQMVQAVRAKSPLTLDDVVIRYPTWTRDVGEAMLFLLRRGAEGVFHVSGPRGGTRYAMTVETASILGEPSDHLKPSKTVVTKAARRPRDSQLATDKIKALGYNHLTDFAAVVRDVLSSFGLLRSQS